MASEKSTIISGLPAGTPASAFALTSTKGDIPLTDLLGKNVVFYFYEGNS